MPEGRRSRPLMAFSHLRALQAIRVVAHVPSRARPRAVTEHAKRHPTL